jgi:hypothetical protein
VLYSLVSHPLYLREKDTLIVLYDIINTMKIFKETSIMSAEISINFKSTEMEDDHLPEGVAPFKKVFREAIEEHLSDYSILEPREKRGVVDDFFDTVTYDEDAHVESTPIVVDLFDPGSLYGHDTKTVGYDHVADLKITMNIEDVSKLALLGLGTDEVEEIIKEVVDGEFELDFESVDFNPLVKKVLDDNLTKREQSVGQKYVAIPTTMPDLLTEQSLDNLPKFGHKESLLIVGPTTAFHWPIYEGDPSELLDAQTWDVQQVKDALPLLKKAALDVRSERAPERVHIPNSYYAGGHKVGGALSYTSKIMAVISAHRDNPRIMEMAGLNVQTHVPAGIDQLLVAKNVGSHLKLENGGADLVNNVLKSGVTDGLNADKMVAEFKNNPAKHFADIISVMANGHQDAVQAMTDSIDRAVKLDSPLNDELGQKNNRN